MRVSPERDWKHLLEPYREYFQKTLGPVRYRADDRWIATDYLHGGPQAITPANPYGFQGGHRRIDTPEGAAEFCDTLIPVLKANNGQGVIIWAPTGEDPRGAMYRPDFDVLPPEVEAQWAVIARRFHEAGLKLGVQTRPSDLAVRQDWQHDEVISLDADDPGHRDMLWRRFDNMIQKGCTLFYLDSFGGSLEEVKLMRWLREKLGPDVLTFAETRCDAVLPFSGGYTELKLQASTTNAPRQYLPEAGLREWEIYRWLAPGAQLAARITDASPDGGKEDEFCLSHQIISLVPAFDFNRAPALGALQARRLSGTNRWNPE